MDKEGDISANKVTELVQLFQKIHTKYFNIHENFAKHCANVSQNLPRSWYFAEIDYFSATNLNGMMDLSNPGSVFISNQDPARIE